MLNKTYELYGEGDAMVIEPEGYAKIVRHLAKQTFIDGESDPRLLLHETVREVHLLAVNGECNSNSTSSNPAENNRDRVRVLTSNGNEYYARYCIVTFSVRN
jgi:hypothetical protein